jgi:hypothetical protein
MDTLIARIYNLLSGHTNIYIFIYIYMYIYTRAAHSMIHAEFPMNGMREDVFLRKGSYE